MLGSVESPLSEPLRTIGVDDHAISRLLSRYPTRLIQEWVDITLAAKERFGSAFFKKSPAAFFVNNVRHAGAGTRTPPDWWQELRRAERCGRRRQGKAKHQKNQPVTTKEKDAAALPHALTEAMRVQFEAEGQPADVARRNAKRFSEEYFQSHVLSENDPIGRFLRLLE